MPARNLTHRRGLCVTLAAVLPLIASLFYFVWFKESAGVKGLYGITKLFTLVWPLIAIKYLLGEPTPRPRFDRRHLRAIPLGMLVGLLVAGTLLWLAHGPLEPVLTLGRPLILKKVATIGVARHYLAFALALSLVHSLLEEFYWRFYVFGQLSRLCSLPLAHLLAAVAFAAHHVVIASQFFGLSWGAAMGLAVGLGGGIFSALYQRQRSLVGAWMAHIGADLAIMSIGQYVLSGRHF